MSNLSEEEKKIIKGLKWSQQQMRLGNLPDYNQSHYADVQGLLDLYNKEKEKNKELLYKYKKNGRVLFTPEAIAEKCVSKDKIKDKIKELEKDMVQNGKTIDILYDILEGE